MENKKTFIKFFTSERGASMLEYALLAALISVASIASVTVLGQRAHATFTTIQREMGAGGIVTTAGSDDSDG